MDTTKSVGLYFGSFNPVHIGHMIIANYMVSVGGLDEVWLVVSPHNPLKDKASLANDHDRLHLVQLAIHDNHKLKASNIEFSLPKPSFTIDTLSYLKEKYPAYTFTLIMGADNLATINKWKNYELLLQNYKINVYVRPGYDVGEYASHPNVSLYNDVPLLNISSTYIRGLVKANKSIQYLVPDRVYEYIMGSTLYK
jgi:nicotinate-nucleotide adenylyltransferase